MPPTPTRSILTTIERWYIDLARLVVAMAIGVAASAAIFGGILFGASAVTSPAQDFRDSFVPPTWDDVRPAIIPIAPQHTRSPDVEPRVARTRTLDPRISQIAANLNAQFARNAGQETAFTDTYPRRTLEAWASDTSTLPDDLRDHFVSSLIEVSRHIGDDPAINRIGSVTDRATTLRDALYAYRRDYIRLATAARERTDAANARIAADRSAASAKALMYLGGGAAVLLSLVVVVVLMRIEVHLRRLGG